MANNVFQQQCVINFSKPRGPIFDKLLCWTPKISVEIRPTQKFKKKCIFQKMQEKNSEKNMTAYKLSQKNIKNAWTNY